MRAVCVLPLLAALVGCGRHSDAVPPKTFEECREIVRAKVIRGEYTAYQHLMAKNACQAIDAADPQLQRQLDAVRKHALPLTKDGQVDFLKAADSADLPGPLWP